MKAFSILFLIAWFAVIVAAKEENLHVRNGMKTQTSDEGFIVGRASLERKLVPSNASIPTHSPSASSMPSSPRSTPGPSIKPVTLAPTNASIPVTPPPSGVPTSSPSSPITATPTQKPSMPPSVVMTPSPIALPSKFPSKPPTLSPSQFPTTAPPSAFPTAKPTPGPTSKAPTSIPTASPTAFPSKMPLTKSPSTPPTRAPTTLPSAKPTLLPTTSAPTTKPSYLPTVMFTTKPTSSLSQLPAEKPTTTPTKAPTKAPKKEPCEIDGRIYANGKTVATAAKDTYNGHTTTDQELKDQQQHISYYDGPLSFYVRYKAKFKPNGDFDSGTCRIVMICFTWTDPARRDKTTTIVRTSASFQTVPMTDAKKDADCKDLEWFKCEGGPWYPRADKSIDLIDKSVLKGEFDIKNSKFDIPTCSYIFRANSSLNNFKSSGTLANKSDNCEAPKKKDKRC